MVIRMKILAISDIYGDDEIINQLAQHIEDEDRITLVAGDIGIYHSWADDLERYHRHVTKIFEKISSFSKRVYYVPGDTDDKSLRIDQEKVVNCDKNYEVIKGSMRVGILGLGGAPTHSVKESHGFNYTWDEGEKIIRESLERTLKINLEKIRNKNSDINILLSHSPPYGIADRSIPISLQQIVDRKELPEKKSNDKDVPRSGPKQLGSRVLSRIDRKYEIDLHIFGHVHKRGGIHQKTEGTHFFNVSHLATDPHRLYGRKFLEIDLSKNKLNWEYQSVVRPDLDFETFLETYL